MVKVQGGLRHPGHDLGIGRPALLQAAKLPEAERQQAHKPQGHDDRRQQPAAPHG